MTLLKKSVEGKRFDSRLVEKNVRRGVVSNSDVKSYVDSLPDDSANAVWVAIDEIDEASARVPADILAEANQRRAKFFGSVTSKPAQPEYYNSGE